MNISFIFFTDEISGKPTPLGVGWIALNSITKNHSFLLVSPPLILEGIILYLNPHLFPINHNI